MHSGNKNIAKKSSGERESPLRVLIAAGGTGGHVYPAIAIANALKELRPDIVILFVGTKSHMEWEAVPRAGYEIKSIWISGFQRRLTLKNVLFPIKLATSLVQSLRIVSSFTPDTMIACGGYAAGPVGWVAAKKKVPLFIQEQNSFPGVTNRLLARDAARIFTAFKEADHYFPLGKTVLAGNPTRKSLRQADRGKALKQFGFTADRPVLLILGGSGGAKSINDAMAENLESLHDKLQLQIIWQCGERYLDDLKQRLDTDEYPRLLLVDFLHHMPEAYTAADVVVSRAGALSCSEIALTGNAGILVPSPNVAGDHQSKNAASMAESGAAHIVKDEEATEVLAELVESMISDREKLKAMQKAALKLARPDAAKDIAKEILETINIES
jgi:UDP-N-acetylglucosamine--N-acetylmuramyl-(pentapeptide) pyrophosphoryl-undecaprenol N-acetylglucosamine transferase